MTQQTTHNKVPANTDAILVINCGSSSVKFSLIEPLSGESLLSGLAECLLTADATITLKQNDKKDTYPLTAPFNHQAALSILVAQLQQRKFGRKILVSSDTVLCTAVSSILKPTLITEEVELAIGQLAQLAPLHNPANSIGIKACQQAFADLPQVAVFDTAFHQSMPAKAYVYGLPYSLYKDHGIRRYGFHGTSHYFVANQAAKLLNKPLSECNLISAHLGNGCSVTVIKNGKSVDTSLGMTPVEGVMMGTRSGDLDAGILFSI